LGHSSCPALQLRDCPGSSIRPPRRPAWRFPLRQGAFDGPGQTVPPTRLPLVHLMVSSVRVPVSSLHRGCPHGRRQSRCGTAGLLLRKGPSLRILGSTITVNRSPPGGCLACLIWSKSAGQPAPPTGGCPLLAVTCVMLWVTSPTPRGLGGPGRRRVRSSPTLRGLGPSSAAICVTPPWTISLCVRRLPAAQDVV